VYHFYERGGGTRRHKDYTKKLTNQISQKPELPTEIVHIGRLPFHILKKHEVDESVFEEAD
jgi:hypothetical protein